MKTGRRPIGRRLLVATLLMVAAYVVLFATVSTESAVLLVVLLPLGVGCLVISLLVWLYAVLREAREKDLL